jgi:hypothetical protein
MCYFCLNILKKKLKQAVEAYIFKGANTFKGYLLPKELYEVSPANHDDEYDYDGGGGGGGDDDDDDDDDDNNNYIMIGYIKLT